MIGAISINLDHEWHMDLVKKRIFEEYFLKQKIYPATCVFSVQGEDQ